MSITILYSSQSGNTAMLAKWISSRYPEAKCEALSQDTTTPVQADLLFVGFWTDQGTCDPVMKAMLSSLRNQKIFLFGTAGFGGDPTYFQGILQRVQENLDPSNTVVGTFMCQGKMPSSVRKRYESMPDSPTKEAYLTNFDQARSHPSLADHDALDAVIQAI